MTPNEKLARDEYEDALHLGAWNPEDTFGAFLEGFARALRAVREERV